MIARNVERTTFLVASEGDIDVLLETLDSREVHTNGAEARCQVRVDLVDGLTIEPGFNHPGVVGISEADQGHSDGRTLDHPRLIAPCLEDPLAVDRCLQSTPVSPAPN